MDILITNNSITLTCYATFTTLNIGVNAVVTERCSTFTVTKTADGYETTIEKTLQSKNIKDVNANTQRQQNQTATLRSTKDQVQQEQVPKKERQIQTPSTTIATTKIPIPYSTPTTTSIESNTSSMSK